MRRKPRVVWLPPELNQAPDNVPTTGWGLIGGAQLAISGALPTASAEVPIVVDAPADPATSSLSDLESSGYRLRRIVGKIFVVGDDLDDTSGIAVIGVTAGLIVRRVDPAGASLASQLGTNQEQSSPSEAQNWTDPWLWRRSWLINNPNFGFGSLPGLPAGTINPPFHNVLNGSAVDGPHVDQKTARIIGPEERLFLDVSVTALLGADGQSELTNETQVFYELRVLASMKTSTGNRRNASR